MDQLQEVELTGPGCRTASRRIVEAGTEEGGGTSYEIQPTQTGGCGIEVFFKNGLTFSENSQSNPLTITKGPGCCTGLYPDPLGASEIQVCPQADAAADAETIRDSAPGS